MTDPSGNSPSKHHHLLNWKPLHTGNIEFLSSITYSWEDDHTKKLKNNQWKCLWCNIKLQGINTNKAPAHIVGTKCMHLKICRASIYQNHLSIYNVLQQLKAAKKDINND